MKNKSFVFGILIMAISTLALLIWNRAASTKDTETSSNKSRIFVEDPSKTDLFVRPHSPRYGNIMSRVTVVEWLDPECESCRQMHPTMKRVIADYQDRVHFVIRYMPYHGNSLFAACVLEEAKDQGKFDEALSILFEKQPEWGSHHAPRPELIPSYVEKLGIPGGTLEKEKVIANHEKKIQMDKEDGEKVGVKGTPSFFVNQKPLDDLGDEPLRAAIEAALASQN